MTEHEKRIREALAELDDVISDETVVWTTNVAATDLRALLADLDAMRGALERISCAAKATVSNPEWIAAHADAALSEAKAGGWQPIETAPKHPVCQDGNNHYSEYILAWWPGAIAPTRCRWWSRYDTPACNFVADGGYAVFPTVFQPLPAPPAQKEPT